MLIYIRLVCLVLSFFVHFLAAYATLVMICIIDAIKGRKYMPSTTQITLITTQ
jgi:hypothetical protein